MRGIINRNRLIVIFGSLIIASIFCIPYLNGTIKVGADTTFHMNRIESIKESIENGVLYPYVYTEQNYGFGYGTAAFYGQIFLYPAVLLRMIGFNIATTWRIYIFLIVSFISLSMCYSTQKVLKTNKYWLILLSSALCIFNTFLISRALQRAALGEMLALIFIPLILAETYKLIKNKVVNSLRLGVLFSCLLMSHNISFVLTTIVFAITLLFNIKNIIKNKLYFGIIKAAIFAILLSSIFIFPILEQLNTKIYNINNKVSNSKTLDGINILEYFDFYTTPYSLKIAINAALFILPIISLFIKNKNTLYISITGVTLLFISSQLFPWSILGFLGFIQFPTRLITIALPYLSIASVVIIDYTITNKNKLLVAISSILLLESLIGFSISMINIYKDKGLINNNTTTHNLKTGETLYIDNNIHFAYNIPETSGNEYLPTGFYGDFYGKSLIPQIESSDQKIDLLYKNFNEQNYKVTIKDDTTFVFPKTFYKGYVVNIYKNGEYIETLQTKPDNKYNAFVSVTLNDDYKGHEVQLQLVYKYTRVQKISIIISLITLISSIIYSIYKKKTI